ncbi:MAG: hypothetical protein U0270_43410 [Labilithrix sp.]
MSSTKAALISVGFISLALVANACGDDDSAAPGSSSGTTPGSSTSGNGGSSGNATSSGATSGGASSGTAPITPPEKVQSGPPAGNPDGHAEVPAEGKAEDVSAPAKVIGTGTADSCKAADFVAAVKAGGVITFNCGADPVTITLTETAKVYNNVKKVVIDGGNKITLSGGGKIRILHQDSCDKTLGGYPQGPGDCNWTAGTTLVVQNITFVDGNTKGVSDKDNGAGGGAIWVHGGSTLKVINARFFNNVCEDKGSDLGGAAIRKLDYWDGASTPPHMGPSRPAWVVNSTFGGADGYGNTCANGGALSSIHTSWNIYNSVFSHNSAIGTGANKGDGGNGGAIYNDGNEIVMQVFGSYFHDNHANEGGSAIFFVSNNSTGTITVTDSKFEKNPKGQNGFQTGPGFYVKAKEPLKNVNSTILP